MVRRKRKSTISSKRHEWNSHAPGWRTCHGKGSESNRRVTNSMLTKRRRLSGDVESAQHGPWWTTVANGWSFLKAFCDNTSLHGLRYVTADGMPFFHRQRYRLLWVATCVAGLLGAGWLIWSVWLRYATSPTVTMVQDTSYPLYRIPFPAVTVCSVNKVLRSEAQLFVSEYTGKDDPNITRPFLSVIGALGLMSYPTYHRPFQYLNYDLRDRPLLKDVNVTALMLRVMPRCNDIFVACFWKGMEVDCCKQFLVQRTEEGFCYSFNSRTAEGLNHTHWSESLLRNNAAGATTGLELFFKGQAGQAIEGFDILRGINVHIHHPDAFPDVAKGLFVPEASNQVMMAQVCKLQVSPSQTVSTEEVRAVALSLRRCYFPGEAKITELPARRYQQDSCFMACRMRFLAKACNCTPYFFPRSSGVRECGASDLECLCNNNAATRSNKPPRGTPGFDPEESALDCDCLPPCTETQYSVESNYIQTSNLESKRGMGYVDVFFKQMGGVRYRNDVMFGWMDLLVSFGGIAGLFLGFSLLSGAELLYWVFAGVVVCFRRDRRRHGPEQHGVRWLLQMSGRRPASSLRSPRPASKTNNNYNTSPDGYYY